MAPKTSFILILYGSNLPANYCPLYNEEDDFSFPFQLPNDESINFPPLIEDHNTLSCTSSLPPMSEYQDLSIFLGDDHKQDYTLIGQYDTSIHDTINWASPIEQVVGLDHGQVQQGGVQYYQPTITTTTTTIDDQAAVGGGGGGVGEGSSSKKLDHNAKEKIRRMKLNETYLTLRSLLPESKKAKKRLSAPYIIDKALDYIPQLQAEVKKLTLEKIRMQSMLEKKQQVALDSDDHNVINKDSKTLTVSINEVKSGEIIIQICEQNNKVGILSSLIAKLEDEGLQILGASSLRACEDRSCFHLHVQNNSPASMQFNPTVKQTGSFPTVQNRGVDCPVSGEMQKPLEQPISPSQFSQTSLQHSQSLQGSPQTCIQIDSQLQTPLHSNRALVCSKEQQHHQSPNPCRDTGSNPVIVISEPASGALSKSDVSEDSIDCEWSEHICPDGCKYYFNCATCESRWEKPEEFALYEQQLQKRQLQNHSCQESHPSAVEASFVEEDCHIKLTPNQSESCDFEKPHLAMSCAVEHTIELVQAETNTLGGPAYVQ